MPPLNRKDRVPGAALTGRRLGTYRANVDSALGDLEGLPKLPPGPLDFQHLFPQGAEGALRSNPSKAFDKLRGDAFTLVNDCSMQLHHVTRMRMHMRAHM